MAESDFPLLQDTRPPFDRDLRLALASNKFLHFGTTFRAALAFAIMSVPLGAWCAV